MTDNQVLCGFCKRTFKPRGLVRHQKSCKAYKKVHEAPPRYNFCVGNVETFHLVLSYLPNQALTKLQQATGDTYDQCKPELAKYACSECDNDHPAMEDGLCTDCILDDGTRFEKITLTMAKQIYRVKNFHGIPADIRKKYTLYARTDLEDHQLEYYGSYLTWLRAITKVRESQRKRIENKKARQDAIDQAFGECSKEFQLYYRCTGPEARLDSIAHINSQYGRFVEMSDALHELKLTLRNDSRLCSDYVWRGVGDAKCIALIIEEMSFLFNHTNYERRCENLIEESKEINGWMPREYFREMVEDCRDGVKHDLREKYMSGQLESSVPLPKLWTRKRIRSEE